MMSCVVINDISMIPTCLVGDDKEKTRTRNPDTKPCRINRLIYISPVSTARNLFLRVRMSAEVAREGRWASPALFDVFQLAKQL